MAKQPTLFNFFGKSPKTSTPKEDCKKFKLKGEDFKLYDLVWCKMEGFPWWPSIICNHPVSRNFMRKKQIHVQFFEDPPTRGWINEKFVKHYGSPDKTGIPTYTDPMWIKAKNEADGTALLLSEERSKIIANLLPSESEDSDENMDDSDQSKENFDINAKKSTKRLQVDDDDSDVKQKSKKRRLVLVSDSEVSEDEYKPDKDSDSDDSISSGVDENACSSNPDTESEASPSPSPLKENKKRKFPQQTVKSKKNLSFNVFKKPSTSFANNSFSSDSAKSKLASFAATAKEGESSNSSTGSWPHTKLEWLQPEFIKDANRCRPSDEDYNSRTLYVPEDFLNKQTPALRQWWKMKSQHFDTILFFKMGKFYELYHMDAVISVQELGLLMMRGENAHTGFPESAYGRYSSTLIDKGFKVARVEQTETPDMMEKRCKKLSHVTKYDKVVRRELCQITSRATRIPSVMDGETEGSDNSFLLSLTEKIIDGTGEKHFFGVSFIDTTIGTFHVGQFEDDRHISRLRTLLSHHPPAQVIYEGGRLSSQALNLVKSSVADNLLEKLTPEKEFWAASKTLTFLNKNDYFKKGEITDWPEAFNHLTDEGDSLRTTPSRDFELGISALGGLIFYLKLCQLEEDLLTRKLFEIYNPPDFLSSSTEVRTQSFKKHMILDGTALQNLEVFRNSDGTSKGTLYEVVNHCRTPFGKRLLYNWICSPLCCPKAINSRLDAIEDLIAHKEIISQIDPLLKKIPDLERLLSKIHSQGLKRSENHPDSRAIFFEQHTYSQRKVQEFISALCGFESALAIQKSFEGVVEDLKSSLLKSILKTDKYGGKFPSLKDPLKFFQSSFNQAEAKKEGKIIPASGVDPQYDEAVNLIKETNKELNEYLSEQTKYFGIKISYWGTEKKRFQLEVPDHAAKKAGDDYEFVSQRKGFKRFWTDTTKRLLAQMISAEELKVSSLRDIARRIFYQFDERIKEWRSAVECLSVLDVLLSLAKYSESIQSCRPEIEPQSEETPFIEIEEGRHPCNIKVLGDDYIPNDLVMGVQTENSHAPLILVTGPNMGGKSTLMRQTALICLLAQLGSYVPATKCRLSAVDRIFTRVGARDRIFQGESTFYVELAETASIIQHSTKNSLIIIDELGRGTATYDGTAIASSVVDKLTKIGCRTLFSTHYHSLVDDFKGFKGISLGHMACMVEGESTDDPTQENIIFLYKFTGGACPKSYGFNAARLADLSVDLIRCASKKADELEKTNIKKKLFGMIFASVNNENSKNLLMKLNSI